MNLNTVNLTIKRQGDKVIYSLESDKKTVMKRISIIYVAILFGFNVFMIIPDWLSGDAPFSLVLFANLITITSMIFFTLLSPKLSKFFGKNVSKITDFISYDKNTKLLYFRNENLEFKTDSIKALKLSENKSLFGLTYFITVVTKDFDKTMMPALPFKVADEVLRSLKEELKI